jgi:hypothetical protein
MKTTKALAFALTFTLAFSLVACGGTEENAGQEPVTLPASTLSDAEIIKMANNLMQEGQTVFWWYFSDYPDGLDLDRDENNWIQGDWQEYAKVGRFGTMAELKAATENVFTFDFCEAHFYDKINDNQKFHEIDGVLYHNLQSGGMGWIFALPKEYIVKTVESETIVLNAICDGLDARSGADGGTEYEFDVTLKNIDGAWRLNNWYDYSPEGWDAVEILYRDEVSAPANISEPPPSSDPIADLTKRVNQAPNGDENFGLQMLYSQLSYIANGETETPYTGFASPDKISSTALYNFYLAMAQDDAGKYLSADDSKYHIPIEAIQNTLDVYFSGYIFDPKQIVREPEGTCSYDEEAQEIVDATFVGYGGPAWIELDSADAQANGDIIVSAHGIDMDGNAAGRTETIVVTLTASGYQFKSYEIVNAESEIPPSPPLSESAAPPSSLSTPSSESQSDELQFLSIELSGSINGSPVEKIFTDSTEIEEIANLIVCQKALEDTDGLQVPADVIVATMQDGPGTNFKLTLFPAKIPALNENVLVIQGDLFSFYTDMQAYEVIIEMLD